MRIKDWGVTLIERLGIFPQIQAKDQPFKIYNSLLEIVINWKTEKHDFLFNFNFLALAVWNELTLKTII